MFNMKADTWLTNRQKLSKKINIINRTETTNLNKQQNGNPSKIEMFNIKGDTWL